MYVCLLGKPMVEFDGSDTLNTMRGCRHQGGIHSSLCDVMVRNFWELLMGISFWDGRDQT